MLVKLLIISFMLFIIIKLIKIFIKEQKVVCGGRYINSAGNNVQVTFVTPLDVIFIHKDECYKMDVDEFLKEFKLIEEEG